MLVTKPIALIVNEFMPQDSKSLVKPHREFQNFKQNFENCDTNPKKKT